MHSSNSAKRWLRGLFSVFCSATMFFSSVFTPCPIQAKAGSDFRFWKQRDPEYNVYPAWPSSLTHGKEHYLGEYGCLVSSIAILLRHYDLIQEPDSSFNPLICADRLRAKGLFLPSCDLHTERVGEAFPNFRYAGKVRYTPEKLAELYNQGYACIMQVKNYGHFIAVDDGSVAGHATIFDPDTTYEYLSDWNNVNMIYYFSLSGARKPDSSPHGSVDDISLSGNTLHIRGWAYERDGGPVTIDLRANGQTICSFLADQQRADVGAIQGTNPDCGFDQTIQIPADIHGWNDLSIVMNNTGWQGDLFDRELKTIREYVGPDTECPWIRDVSAVQKDNMLTITGKATDDHMIHQIYASSWSDQQNPDELSNEQLKQTPVRMNGDMFEITLAPENAGTSKFVLWADDPTGNSSLYTVGDFTFDEKFNEMPMFRLYNPNSGEHFYTSSTVERDHLTALGWKNEGTGWIAPGYSAAPVYRIYNPNDGDHHYTTSAAERDHLVSVGWKDEGIGWYSADSSRTPVWRAYNPNAKAGAHHYTPDGNEYDSLGRIGWKPENIAWYSL